MFSLCVQNTVLTYCLKYNWSQLSLISVVIISPNGCMTGVRFDKSLDTCLFPSLHPSPPKWCLLLVPKILKSWNDFIQGLNIVLVWKKKSQSGYIDISEKLFHLHLFLSFYHDGLSGFLFSMLYIHCVRELQRPNCFWKLENRREESVPCVSDPGSEL